MDYGKNLGKYLHKPKKVDRSEDDMSAKTKVNSKIVPNKRPSKSNGSGNVRG